MTESSRRSHNSTSQRIVAASAITLALGGISVIGPGPLAPQASAAAGFTGGLYGADGTGAIVKGDQQASDLPAGSCVVSETGTAEHSQAGFTWRTLEPEASSPDKTLWGLSLSFDNSKDRTFADWSFANSGNLRGYLNAGTVSSMDVGQTFLGENVTRKADENVDITVVGRSQLNLNLYAELTEAKVKQFAEAGADSPVRYAWQSNYAKDPTGATNPTDSTALRATHGDNAIFSAVVNPWPSENIECNPITVSWESFEKHVIVPGEETKVGTINVPAVQNGGKDDSMSRMVVEAHDGNGAFIGNARVADNGEIYFTWPEYRGTDLATDKNVNFSVLAKPRTVEQLQAAVQNNNPGYGKVFNSSNSLTRYNTPNVIDSKAFSLDDTEYHDPKYDRYEQAITSGIMPDGTLTDQSQQVTFTQVPDLITGLEKEKAAGGFEAKVTLDEKYVYEGWDVKMDDNYNVTVTTPTNPRPGTFARPVVIVEYSNGSTDRLELLVVVDPNNTQVTDLVRPGLSKGTIGDELTAQVGTKSIMRGYTPVAPSTFEIDQSTVPDGWTVTIDGTGKVTAVADSTVNPGTVITPKVKATYPDGTTDEIETQFQAIFDIKIPTYDTVTNKPNAKVGLSPQVPERGLSGNTNDEAPKRYTFPDGTTQYSVTDDSGTWTVTLNENTGEITTIIPNTAPEGYILNIPVLTYYDNADKPQQVEATVVVVKSDIAPVYDVQTTGPNQAVNHQVSGAPEKSTFALNITPNEDGNLVTEDGWTYTIDPNTGVVSATPPETAKPGDKKTVTATVEAPDGSRSEVPVTTVVKLTNNWEAEPTYPVETVYPGGTATLPLDINKPANINVAEENPYTLGNIPEGWNATIDGNGQVTATSPADAKPGDQIKIPVTVTYEDGSTDTTYAVVNIVDAPVRPVPFGIEYKYDNTIPAGTYTVETEGKPGVEKQQNDGSWMIETAPTNEVVRIGTKPAEVSKDIVWTFPIPYPTEIRENPDLKPGEMNVIQEGEYGEKTYTAKFTSTGSEAQVAEEEVTKEAKPRIIEYGPGIDDQTLKTETTRPIEFSTEYVLDTTLPAGEQKVDQQGVNGEEKITSTQEIKDGKPVGDPKITTEVTKKPVNAIIRVGVKPETTTATTTATALATVTSEKAVPTTITTEVPTTVTSVTTVQGAPTTVTETKPVPTTIVTTVPTTVPTTVKETTTATTTVTESPKPLSKKVKLPFTTRIVFDPTLEPGQQIEDVKGVDGEIQVTFDGVDATAETVKEPVQRVVRVGSKPADGAEWTEEIPFDVKVEEDPNLEAGKYQVIQGQPGKVVHNADGTETRTDPVTQIIKVGTKGPDAVSHSTEVETPFPVRVVYDPNLKAGESQVTQEGKPGKKKVTMSQDVVNGKPTGAVSVSEEVLEEPIEQIVAVGTKPEEAASVAKWVAPLPYDTIVVPNNDLKPGEIRIAQKGEFGEKEFVADFNAVGSSSTVNTTEKVIKNSKPQIIEYGPMVPDQTLTSVEHREVAFSTEFVFDDTMDAGTQRVENEGQVGLEKITSVQEVKDGKPVGAPKISTEQILAPQNRVVRIGSKPVTTTVREAPERVTETEKVTTTVTVPNIAETTTVLQPTTVTQDVATVTEVVPTTVTTEVKNPVVVTTTVEGEPTTVTTTEMVPTTITTSSLVEVTVTNDVTATEKVTETETVTTTVNPASPEVHVNGSTIEYWQQKGEPIAVKIRDENVDAGSLRFRLPDGVIESGLKDNGKVLELPGVGTYTVDGDTVIFTPQDDFLGDVPVVEIDYTRTDGAKVVTPITVIGHYNDCGCKASPSLPESSGDVAPDQSTSEDVPEPSEPTVVDPEPSEPMADATEPSEPTVVDTDPSEPTVINPEPSDDPTVVVPEPSEPTVADETPRNENTVAATTPATKVKDTPSGNAEATDTVSDNSTSQAPEKSISRILASTGANIIGLVAIAGLLIGIAVFIMRRKK